MITINKKSDIYGAVKIAYSIQQSIAGPTPHTQVLNGEMFTTDNKRAIITQCALEDGFYKIIKAGSDYLLNRISEERSLIPALNRLRVVEGLQSYLIPFGSSSNAIQGAVQQTRADKEGPTKYYINPKWAAEFADAAGPGKVDIYYSKPTYPVICCTDTMTWICMPAEG